MFQEIQDWQLQRLGKFTASEIHKLLQSGKGKDEYFGKTALSYIDEKIAELITGQPIKDISGLAAIEWGNAHEYEGLMILQDALGKPVTIYGGSNNMFFPYNEFSGGSIDAETDDEVIEAKCPYNAAVHTANLIAALKEESNAWMKKNRAEYYAQLQFNMMCRQKDKGIFYSYDPRPLNESHRKAIIRIAPDEELREGINERLVKAAEIVSVALELLQKQPSVLIAEYDKDLNTTIVS